MKRTKTKEPKVGIRCADPHSKRGGGDVKKMYFLQLKLAALRVLRAPFKPPPLEGKSNKRTTKENDQRKKPRVRERRRR